MSDPCFSIFPIELLQRDDLTPQEIRVLVALYSFRGKNSNTVWPSLDLLAERAGIRDRTQVSKVTTRLVDKGFLIKKKRGFSGGNVYELVVPDAPAPLLEESSNNDGDVSKKTSKSKVSPLVDSSKLEKSSKMEKFSNPNLEKSSKCNEVTNEVTNYNNNNKNNNSACVEPVPVSDWSPGELVFEMLDVEHGVNRVFAEQQLAEFMFFWRDRGDADNWDSRFIERVCERWQRNGKRWQKHNNLAAVG